MCIRDRINGTFDVASLEKIYSNDRLSQAMNLVWPKFDKLLISPEANFSNPFIVDSSAATNLANAMNLIFNTQTKNHAEKIGYLARHLTNGKMLKIFTNYGSRSKYIPDEKRNGEIDMYLSEPGLRALFIFWNLFLKEINKYPAGVSSSVNMIGSANICSTNVMEQYKMCIRDRIIRYLYGLKIPVPQSWKDRYHLD